MVMANAGRTESHPDVLSRLDNSSNTSLCPPSIQAPLSLLVKLIVQSVRHKYR